MNLKELQDYNNWIGKSPRQILDDVKNYGWVSVFNDLVKFPKGLPIWAHRVRNYFNLEPYFLTRLDEKESKIRLKRIAYSANIRDEGMFDAFKRSRALSDHVYLDETKTEWFQMSPGGTIYHFKDVTNQAKEAVAQEVLGQSRTPIFKLVSPDSTGGSCETIIKNMVQVKSTAKRVADALMPLSQLPKTGPLDSSIGHVNAVSPVARLIVDIPKFQGSYNYAETVSRGFADHEKLDIEPHTDYKKWDYDNPSDRHSKLESRRFQKYAKGEEGKIPLAEQIYK